MIEPTQQFWEKAYERNIGKLIGVCFRYTRDYQLSEDLAHDAFIKTIEKYKSFEGRGQFDAWLRRVVVNHVLQHLRDSKRNGYLDDLKSNRLEISVTEETAPPNKTMVFTAAELLDIIAQLPEHHRWVFNLYVMEKYTHAQIAEELGISEGTSKSHLSRARKKLKELLTKKAEENQTHLDDRNLLLLLLSQNGDKQVEQLFTERFEKFSMPPRNPLSLDSILLNDPTNIGTLFFKPTMKILTISGSIAIVTIGIIIIINPWKSIEKIRYSEPMETPLIKTTDSVNDIQKIKIDQSKTATISKDSVISNRNIKQKRMKPLDSLALIIAISSSTLNAVTTQDSIKKQIETIHSNAYKPSADSLGVTNNIKPVLTGISAPKERGTFRASRLFWSKENNEVYLKGKVSVDFMDQHFQGSGSFNVLGKIYLLVVDGQEVELGQTLRLSEDKYELVLMGSNEAIAKYGNKGQQGALEITRAVE